MAPQIRRRVAANTIRNRLFRAKSTSARIIQESFQTVASRLRRTPEKELLLASAAVRKSAVAAVIDHANNAASEFVNPIGVPCANGVGWQQLVTDAEHVGSGADVICGRLLSHAAGGN